MPKLLFFITEDWYFCSHRLQLAAAAKKAGYDVAILTHLHAHREIIEAAGIRVIPLDLQRRSLNPIKELKTLLSGIFGGHNTDLLWTLSINPDMHQYNLI